MQEVLQNIDGTQIAVLLAVVIFATELFGKLCEKYGWFKESQSIAKMVFALVAGAGGIVLVMTGLWQYLIATIAPALVTLLSKVKAAMPQANNILEKVEPVAKMELTDTLQQVSSGVDTAEDIAKSTLPYTPAEQQTNVESEVGRG